MDKEYRKALLKVISDELKAHEIDVITIRTNKKVMARSVSGRKVTEAIQAASMDVTSTRDPYEAASAQHDAERDIAIITIRDQRAKGLLRAWERVLTAKKDYGICDNCQDSIPTARLMAEPNAKRCKECQEMFEEGTIGQRLQFTLPKLDDDADPEPKHRARPRRNPPVFTGTHPTSRNRGNRC